MRQLIEEELIPDDVTVQVLTQAREELIGRTFESLRGARRAIVHLYNSTSTTQRRVVFGLDREGIRQIAVERRGSSASAPREQPDTDWTFEYSPESFTVTELDFALEICERVIDVWQPTPQRKVILNLPATVEVATPNVYADQIEWMQPAPRATRPHRAIGASAQRSRHRRRRGRTRGDGRRRPRRGLPVRQRRAHRQRLHRHAGD